MIEPFGGEFFLYSAALLLVNALVFFAFGFDSWTTPLCIAIGQAIVGGAIYPMESRK